MLKTFISIIMCCVLCLTLYAPNDEAAIHALCGPDNFCQHQSSLLNPSALPFGNKMGKFIKESTNDKTNYRIKKIVIDAGHGGKDNGTKWGDSKEKDIALNVTLLLGQLVQDQFPGVEVLYTRQSDVFIPLHERAALANENEADLFLSIHCNALRTESVYGSETYVMGMDVAEENLEVSKRENSSILMEDNYSEIYKGFDPNSSEGHIFLSMFQNAYLEQSIALAEKIEQNFKTNTGRKSRGVKQGDFVVLRQTTMPSVLIETGYLSNESDNNFLSTKKGQYKVASSILKAFEDYKNEIEGS